MVPSTHEEQSPESLPESEPLLLPSAESSLPPCFPSSEQMKQWLHAPFSPEHASTSGSIHE